MVTGTDFGFVMFVFGFWEVHVLRSNREYMLFESYSMIVDTNVYSFSNYTDETKYLHNIKPQSLRIYAEDASIYLQSIYVNTNTSTTTLEQAENLRYNYYASMNQQKIAKLNSQISKRGMRWTHLFAPAARA